MLICKICFWKGYFLPGKDQMGYYYPVTRVTVNMNFIYPWSNYWRVKTVWGQNKVGVNKNVVQKFGGVKNVRGQMLWVFQMEWRMRYIVKKYHI